MQVNSSQGTDWQTVSIKADAKAGPTEHFQSFDLTGLDPDTMYKVKIQAENIYGWGDINDPFQFGTNKGESHQNVMKLRKRKKHLFMVEVKRNERTT